MNTEKVSVVIPVYNGEKYLTRCIESVINQSYKNLEIIFIDDNSNDSTNEIINNYCLIHKNITYIKNIQNLGAAESRNIGLKKVHSKYVLFLDCDDWIDLNCIEKAINKFNTNSDIDIVVWEIKTAFQDYKICSRYDYLYDNTLTNTMALNLLSHSIENEFFLSPLLGCKLFKKSLLDKNSIVFPNTLYEDDMFTYLAFLKCRNVGLVTGSYLYYYQHQSSITHHFTDKNITDFFKTFKQLYEYIDNQQKECFYKYLYKSFNAMLNSMINNTKDFNLQKKYKALIFSLFYQNINIEEYYQHTFSITI